MYVKKEKKMDRMKVFFLFFFSKLNFVDILRLVVDIFSMVF